MDIIRARDRQKRYREKSHIENEQVLNLQKENENLKKQKEILISALRESVQVNANKQG